MIFSIFMKTFDLLNTTRCGNLFYSEMNTYSLLVKTNKNNVKMSLTWRRSAWVLKRNPSETQRSTFSTKHQVSKDKEFYDWLVGIIDGDGTFYFAKTKKGTWNFSFQIAQSSSNVRLLYYIKSKLKVGTLNISKNTTVYRVRKIEHLKQYILPIFDTYSLLTSKFFNYYLFNKAILIYTDTLLTKEEKNNKILKLKEKKLPLNYMSPAWEVVNKSINTVTEAKKIMSKSWIIGFTEAEGSFYIIKETKTKRCRHCFEITQKRDEIVLKSLSYILKLKLKKKKTYITVIGFSNNSIEHLIDYFFKTMKGLKSLEYRLWARSFKKRKKGYEYLSKIQLQMQKIRSVRYHKKI